jgi:hypothetical protein
LHDPYPKEAWELVAYSADEMVSVKIRRQMKMAEIKKIKSLMDPPIVLDNSFRKVKTAEV